MPNTAATSLEPIPFVIVDIAKNYIDSLGGFEKFAEWGLF
jgi:hypothetical protein